MGTRVSLKKLFDSLEAGDSLNQFLEDYPSVSREQALAALELAREAASGHASSARPIAEVASGQLQTLEPRTLERVGG